MALIGNTPDAYGQTWHLPCDDQRLTYKQIINQSSQILQRKLPYKILPMLFSNSAAFLTNKQKTCSNYYRGTNTIIFSYLISSRKDFQNSRLLPTTKESKK